MAVAREPEGRFGFGGEGVGEGGLREIVEETFFEHDRLEANVGGAVDASFADDEDDHADSVEEGDATGNSASYDDGASGTRVDGFVGE